MIPEPSQDQLILQIRRLGLSATKVGAMCDVSPHTIRKFLRGEKVYDYILYRIDNALNNRVVDNS